MAEQRPWHHLFGLSWSDFFRGTGVSVEPHNAMLLLFSAKEDLVAYAAGHDQPHSVETNTLLLQLVARYREERIPMPETLEEMTRRTIAEILSNMTVEERLRGGHPRKSRSFFLPRNS